MFFNLVNANKSNLKILKYFVFILMISFFQGCTSSVEVAANIGKKYLIPKKKVTISPKPIYKIGKKYNVKNKYYFPKKNLYYDKTGIASWYGPKFHGKLTANGEMFNQNALTAAHKTLPLPSAVRVINLQNNKSVIVRINDRGPFVNDRIIDLSSKAADILGLKKKGTGLVRVTILKEKSIMLEKLAKNGSFPEISDLPKPEVPKVNIPKITTVKIEGSKKTNKSKKKINYNLKNLKNEYSIYIKLASFSSLESAKTMKEKLSYLEKVKIYELNVSNKVLYQVKAGPFLSVEKVDKIHTLLLEKGMQGAKIIIE